MEPTAFQLRVALEREVQQAVGMNLLNHLERQNILRLAATGCPGAVVSVIRDRGTVLNLAALPDELLGEIVRYIRESL